MSQINSLIEDFSTTNLIAFLRASISSFKPDDDDLDHLFPEDIYDKYESIVKVGEAEINKDELIVIASKTTEPLTERTGKKNQYNIAKTILKHELKDAALFVFYDENGNFRFSFVRANYLGTKREFTDFKRYTYFVTPSQTNKTFIKQVGGCKFNSLDEIIEAFSVEKLTKEFFNELFSWYEWALSDEIGITYPNNTNTSDDDRIKLEEQVIRLITRLLFVWFIKQKKLVPEYLFKIEDLKKSLKDFDYNSSEQGNYYNAIIQNLFFATLNKAIHEREFAKLKDKRDIKTRYRYEEMFNLSEFEILKLFKPVPFLNGGLFECLDKKDAKGNDFFLDGFSRNATKSANGNFRHRAFIPNCLFFDEKKGIIPLLRRYNFTVEENAPNEVQVALEPELLGKVFENLLGSFNPETKETARKQSGSFYTRREIVDYMVDESLITYLQNKLPHVEKNLLRALFENEQLPKDLAYNINLRNVIATQLKAIKILDPACGSGAFPMGILNRMVEVLEKLYVNNESIYDLKLHLIEECIYGIDIQPIAIQISKLRFFISLVVEQEDIDINEPDENYGVLTLPNLETKFVAANTLIGIKAKPKQHNLFEDPLIEETKQKLLTIRHEHFYAKTAGAKKRLRELDSKLRDKLADLLKENKEFAPKDALQLSQWNPYDQNTSSSFFDMEWMFGIKEGFDLIIGNPPYIKEYVFKDAFDGFRDSIYYKGKMDLWHGFSCICIDYLKKNGILTFIAQNNWVTNYGAEKMRDKVIKDTKIINITDFNHYMIFESADIQTSVMIFQKDNKTEVYDFDFRKLHHSNNKYSDVIDVINKVQNKNTLYRPNFKRSAYMGKYLLFNEERIENILFKVINKGQVYLNKNEVAQGIVFPQDYVNKSAKKLVTNTNIGDGIFVLSENEISDLKINQQERQLLKPFYDSKRLKRYYGNKKFVPKKYIIYTDSTFKDQSQMNNFPNLKKHLDKYKKVITSDNKPYGLHRSREEDFFLGEKIISLRKCSDRPTFTYTDFECYVSATFYVIKTNRINLKYLTALLNSTLYKFWFKYKGKMQGSNYQIDKQPLLDIPIFDVNNTTKEKIIGVVDSILEKKKEEIDTTELEHQIDVMVYKLYNLNYQDVRITDPEFPLTQEEYDNYKIK